MRTRAENEQAEAALLYRRKHPYWQERLRTKYGISKSALKVLMGGGDRVCLCGRATIAGDGTCMFCEWDEQKLGRQYTDEELTTIRLRSWIDE